MKPQRIQLKRTKGWRMPANTMKVDRSTPWGNPFPVGSVVDTSMLDWVLDAAKRLSIPHDTPLTTEQSVAMFKALVEKNLRSSWGKLMVKMLRGKNLACWCKPGEPCHADVLLEIANQPEAGK